MERASCVLQQLNPMSIIPNLSMNDLFAVADEEYLKIQEVTRNTCETLDIFRMCSFPLKWRTTECMYVCVYVVLTFMSRCDKRMNTAHSVQLTSERKHNSTHITDKNMSHTDNIHLSFVLFPPEVFNGKILSTSIKHSV